jgi:hypothetical protein
LASSSDPRASSSPGHPRGQLRVRRDHAGREPGQRGHERACLLELLQDPLPARTPGQQVGQFAVHPVQYRDTLLRDAVADQAALHGVLAQIEALGLDLIELRRLLPVVRTHHGPFG